MQNQQQQQPGVRHIHTTRKNDPVSPIEAVFVILDDAGDEQVEIAKIPSAEEFYGLCQQQNWLTGVGRQSSQSRLRAA